MGDKDKIDDNARWSFGEGEGKESKMVLLKVKAPNGTGRDKARKAKDRTGQGRAGQRDEVRVAAGQAGLETLGFGSGGVCSSGRGRGRGRGRGETGGGWWMRYVAWQRARLAYGEYGVQCGKSPSLQAAWAWGPGGLGLKGGAVPQYHSRYLTQYLVRGANQEWTRLVSRCRSPLSRPHCVSTIVVCNWFAISQVFITQYGAPVHGTRSDSSVSQAHVIHVERGSC